MMNPARICRSLRLERAFAGRALAPLCNRSILFTSQYSTSSPGLPEPSAKVKRLVDELLALNLVEVNQCGRLMAKLMGVPPEQMFTKAPGFSSFGGGPSSAPSAAAAEPVKVKEAFDLKLTEASAAAKIKIIKEVRAITGLGLKEAKELVEKSPVVVKQGLKKDEAEKLLKVLVEAGAKAELV